MLCEIHGAQFGGNGMEQRNMRELLQKYKYYVIGAAVVLVVIIALVRGRPEDRNGTGRTAGNPDRQPDQEAGR